ncbi:MAG TPA: hypothetical protein ENI96_13055 [Sedimenticola thiotaurini]|uniref:Uncharacterized protein n=1 Tax=Sedimenticola thiotaurini TaxID=1543721 RepID=A0A831RMD8_9GAMM|nr:hypothetical protein [Sedimenticola thiotaurini]
MAEAARNDERDQAWAGFDVPIPPAELVAFCQDVERLFRINPYLEFDRWECLGEGSWQVRGRNLSRQPPLAFDLTLRAEPRPDGLLIRYQGGLKASTRFLVEPAEKGSHLTIVDDYGALDEASRRARLDEVDRSLVKWAEELQAWLLRWQRWSGFAPWRWFMRRVWLPMKPAGRRITYILLLISVAELALIGLGVAIYLAEYR